MVRRKPRYFLLIYKDHDSKTFNVIGPITDDTAVTTQTVKLQEAGQSVNIETTDPQIDPRKVPSVESVIRQGVAGYTYDSNLGW